MNHNAGKNRTPLERLLSVPLYGRIVVGVLVGVLLGCMFGPSVGWLNIPGKLILQLLGALAPPLILLAVVQALVRTHIEGRMGLRLAGLLLLNTLVAISIGLLVANVLQPGRGAELPSAESRSVKQEPKVEMEHIVLDQFPRSVLGPLTDGGRVIGVIMLAIAFGLALRRVKHPQKNLAINLVDVALEALVIVLHWLVQVVPLAVLGVVASIVGLNGFEPFRALGYFVSAVLVALALQATYYLLRVRFFSWVSPWRLLSGTRDALLTAFSTGSSTIAMPLTYECLKDRVGLRDESANMGALIGANFNNDGTALYEAMSALFVAQLLGMHLSLGHQLIVVATSVLASVGAAGIPEAGLVTMTLVFKAVGLPIEHIAMLLTVDWFLDRCRTAVNVMGDTNISCLLDGRTPKSAGEPSVAVLPAVSERAQYGN